MDYDLIADMFLIASMTAGCLIISRYLFHLFQLESYQFAGYFRALRRNFRKSFIPGVVLCVSSIIIFIFAGVMYDYISPIISSVLCLLMISIAAILIRHFSIISNEKKPLVMTKRMIRLYLFAGLGIIIIMFAVRTLCNQNVKHPGSDTVFEYLCPLFPIFLPLLIAFGALLAMPFEKLIASYYFKDAQKTLDRNHGLVRIGITGSWGKTSVKNILGTLLGIKYPVLITPESINTPMGISRLVRSELLLSHRIFIAEMGARHVGDIRELCRLVKPRYGIITSVGPQHLDTFGTIEQIANTKYDLIQALPDDGCSFFADDHDICYRLYQKTEKEKMLAGFDSKLDDIWAENITLSCEGSHFDLCTGNEKVSCDTVLLGTLNVSNIVLAASVALKLGLNLEQIKAGISAIKAVPHRLQLIKKGGITIIDDAYNSNIAGAMMAFSILKQFPGRHIVVTPGMVELGDQKDILEKRFGEALSLAADYVILVGMKQTKNIQNSLIMSGFRKDHIKVAVDLTSAMTLIKEMSKSGDTILFENDLPDNYSEKVINTNSEVTDK